MSKPMKKVIKENVEKSTVVCVQIFESNNEKRTGLTMRIKSQQKVKRFVNRNYDRPAAEILQFCEKVGIDSTPGFYEVKASKLLKAVKVFPKQKKSA